jgi:hypothetical protein
MSETHKILTCLLGLLSRWSLFNIFVLRNMIAFGPIKAAHGSGGSPKKNYLNEAILDMLPSLRIKNDLPVDIKPPLTMLNDDACTYLLRSLCSATSQSNQRLGCCRPPAPMRALYNVKIEKGKIVVFLGSSSSADQSCKSETKDWSLPPIKSIVKQKGMDSTMGVVFKKERLRIASCKRYVNGTLHVIGTQTAHNPFHTSMYRVFTTD